MHVLIPALHRPTKPTGVCRHAINLARCLAETEPVSRVTLLIGEWQREYFEESFSLDSSKIQLINVDIKNSSLSRNQWFVFGLPKIAQRLRPDIIHMSFPFPFLRSRFDATVVATIHDLYPFEFPENFGYPQVWFNQLFLKQCIDSSDGLTCVSNCTLKALESYFPKVKTAKKATTVYNIVEFAETEPQMPTQLGKDFSFPFLLSVAQHRKNKNLDLLIKAYADLIEGNQIRSQTKLLLVGSAGPETDALNQLVASLKLEESVVFLSGLRDEELRWLYEQADVFAIASSTEGFCLPLVEALTLFCPAVCSDIPILREVGTSQCHYFTLDENAQHHLAEAIVSALSAPSYQSLGESKSTGVKSNHSESSQSSRFSKQEISKQLLNFYASL